MQCVTKPTLFLSSLERAGHLNLGNDADHLAKHADEHVPDVHGEGEGEEREGHRCNGSCWVSQSPLSLPTQNCALQIWRTCTNHGLFIWEPYLGLVGNASQTRSRFAVRAAVGIPATFFLLFMGEKRDFVC